MTPNAEPIFTPTARPFVGIMNKKIAALTAEKKAAQKEQWLIRLREEKLGDFHLELDTGLDEFKQALVLKRIKNIRNPNVYSG